MQYVFRLSLIVLLGLAVQWSWAAESAAPTTDATPASTVVSGDEMLDLVKAFNPTLVVDPERDDPTDIHAVNSFFNPASDMAKDARSLAWIAFWIFLPFLVLPEIILLVVIIKFRGSKREGKKLATFIHNDKLEIAWTAIPIFALIIVSFPSVYYVYKFDNPPANDDPEDRLVMNITGKQFSWIFEYPDHDIELTLSPKIGPEQAGQESPVFVKDRVARLTFSSLDVNHAWSVPAFGVRKDCFQVPRLNYAWFTPDRTGNFDGQCYELCGADHGKMLFTAVVVEQPEFERWVNFRQAKIDAEAVVDALVATDKGDDAEAEKVLETELQTYFSRGSKPRRLDALRYWTTFEYYSMQQLTAAAGDSAGAEAIKATGLKQRARLDKLAAEVKIPVVLEESPATEEKDKAEAEGDQAKADGDVDKATAEEGAE